MAYKRLFIGSFINSALFGEKYRQIQKDFKNIISGKWVVEENLHFTYKFLGDTDEEIIPEVKLALSEFIDKPLKMELALGGLGCFTPERPRILYLKVHDRLGGLVKINAAIEEKLEMLGFCRETKGFTPHVTLMRIKNANADLFKQAVARNESFNAGVQTEIEVSLIESVLEKNGATYKKIG